jgi:hypothetical protein
MNDRDWECADLDALASLRADEAGPKGGAKERVLERLTIGLGMAGSMRDAPTPDHSAPPARLFAASHPLVGHPLTLILAFALGGGTGAAAYATFARSPTVVYVDRPVHATESPSASVSEPDVTIESAPSADVRGPNGTAARALSNPGPGGSLRAAEPPSLALQQALLDEARAAFGRGENDAALRAIAAHERRYPESVLSEEREALAIKVLVARGDFMDAKARGTRFIEKHPRSLLLPAVRDSLDTIP